MDTGQENCDGVNSHLGSFFTGIIDKVQRNNTNLLISEVKADFKREFKLPEKKADFSYLKRDDLGRTLKCLLDEINRSIDSILDFLSKNKGGIFNKEKDSFDMTKYIEEFPSEYSEKEEWQSLVYKIQVFHWLKLTYNNDSLKDVYSKTSAESVRFTLNDYIRRLRMLKNEVSVIAGFGDEGPDY